MFNTNKMLQNWHAICLDKHIATTMIEQTMPTITQAAKTVFNALAFANVNNLTELRTQLHQIDKPVDSPVEPKRYKTVSAATDPFSVAPDVRHIQGAL